VTEDDPAQKVAYEEAFREFALLGTKKYFSGNYATHYYIQPLSNGNVALILGAAGTVRDEEGKFAPIADVNGTFVCPPDMMRSLAVTLKNMFLDADEGRTNG